MSILGQLKEGHYCGTVKADDLVTAHPHHRERFQDRSQLENIARASWNLLYTLVVATVIAVICLA